ncbi:MAG: D-alanyl-D-alanine carboxypeptidase [Clostridia bacterium]|nr:D-alanyl-D-alanine carboxypeptidase [Clostridia bacterium]
MKKFIIFLFCFIIIVSQYLFIADAAFTSSIEVEGNIAYMVSADEDSTVIYDKGSQIKCDPGEIVKIVTGILAIENCPELSSVVTASGTAIRSIEHLRVTTAGILVDEMMTVEELLYCLLVYNANDAAVVLAELVGGTVDNFVKMMNDFAVSLGLSNTSFSNPGGYDSNNQYSTAQDIAVIFNYCMKNSTFSQIISTFLYEMPATNKYTDTRYLKNTNNLINSAVSDYYYKYVKGGKSGYTSGGNSNSVSFASKDGYNYICVVLDAPIRDFDNDDVTENMSFVSSKKLFQWAFDNIKLRMVANTSTYVGEVNVRLSKEFDYVSLVPVENVNALVPAGVNAESVFIEPIAELTKPSVDAPVKKGDLLGRAAIKYAGETVAEVDLVAAFDVSLSHSKLVGDLILRIITSPIFIVIVLILAVAIGLLCLISYRNKQMRRKQRLRNNKNINKRG